MTLGLTGLFPAGINIYVTHNSNTQRSEFFIQSRYSEGPQSEREFGLLEHPLPAAEHEDERGLSGVETLVYGPAEERYQVVKAVGDALEAFSRLIRVHS